MAWNGSGVEDRSISQHKLRMNEQIRNRKRRIRIVIVVTFCFILVGVILTAILKNPPDETDQRLTIHSRSHIQTSSNAVKVISKTKIAPTRWPKHNPNRKDGIWRHGEGPRSIAVTNGIEVTYPNDPTVRLLLPRPQDKLPFKHLPDNEIASILSIKPGQTTIIVPLPRDFDDRFAKSLLEPIRIEKDDTPEQIAMKQQVIEARKILVEAVKRGESPREVLMDERKNLHRLMNIRDNYNHIVAEQIHNGATSQEIKDTIDAANQLLEKEGIDNPIRLPYKERIRVMKNKE